MIVAVSKQADKEIFDIYQMYLEESSEEVADRFKLEIKIKLKYLKDFYETGAFVKSLLRAPLRKNQRFVMLDKFPQYIYYHINFEQETVNIERVLHRKRNISSLLKE